jgi:methionyl-tRNA formyltransferase
MRVAFMGNPSFAISSLESILQSRHQLVAVISNPPKPMGRKKILKHTEVGDYAIKNGLELIELNSFKNDAIYKKIISLNIDIFVVVAFKILPEKYISIPRFGSINLHASLLPKYRGAAPIQWALMNGDKTTGITVFQIEKKVDTGKIIFQKKIDVDKSDNFELLSIKLSNLGARILIKALNNIENGAVNFIEQDNTLSTKAPKISKGMLRIKWEWPAVKINNWVRGLSPKPGMTTIYRKKKIKIIKSEVTDELAKGAPGTVNSLNKSLLEIYTGSGLLSIKELQQEGKKCLPIEEFLNGNDINDKDIFY